MGNNKTKKDNKSLVPMDWLSSMEGVLDSGEYGAFIEALRKDPKAEQRLKLLYNDPAKQALVRKIESVLGLAKNGFDLATSLRQISRGKRMYEDLTPPTPPSFPGENPALKGAIDRAIVTSSSPSIAGALSPYQAELGRGFEQARQAAVLGSGGQSGLYSAMAQNIYNRRMEGAEKLPAMAAEMRGRENQNLSSLLGLQGDLQRSKAFFDSDMFRQRRGIYEREALAAGALESAGRQNLSSVLSASIPGIANMIAPAFGIKEMDDLNAAVMSSKSLLNRYVPRGPGIAPAGVGAQTLPGSMPYMPLTIPGVPSMAPPPAAPPAAPTTIPSASNQPPRPGSSAIPYLESNKQPYLPASRMPYNPSQGQFPQPVAPMTPYMMDPGQVTWDTGMWPADKYEWWYDPKTRSAIAKTKGGKTAFKQSQRNFFNDYGR